MSTSAAHPTESRFLRNPLSTRQLAGQLKRAADEYIDRNYSEYELRSLVAYYASHHTEKLFSPLGDGLNPIVEKHLGKRRAGLVRVLLNPEYLDL